MKFLMMLGFVLGGMQAQAVKTNYSIEKITDDVIVRYSDDSLSQHLNLPSAKSNKDLQLCRQHIAKAVCWVDPSPLGVQYDRPCLSGGEQFIAAFEGHFDRSSDIIKKMYCHVDRLWVEKETDATAYASPIMDRYGGKMISGGVGVRQEVVEQLATFDHWLSWKEETSFGGDLSTTKTTMGLINYVSNRPSKDFFFDYVMNHEFGHLFDFANDINERFTTSDWSRLSWKTPAKPNSANDYPLRDRLCYYFCNGNYIDKSDSASIFSGLMKTNFISTYASRHPSEDWAETFAHYIAANTLGLAFHVETQGQKFDMTAHFHSPLLAKKREYVENFLKSAIVYPGESSAVPNLQ